jgi:hypothetical protein
MRSATSTMRIGVQIANNEARVVAKGRCRERVSESAYVVRIASEVGDVDVECLWCGEVRAGRRQGSRLPFLLLQCKCQKGLGRR